MQEQSFKFNLGAQVRDIVTGYQGTVTSQTCYLNGCKQYAVKGKLKKGGEIPKTEFMDEAQLELATKEEVKVKPRPTGGPQDTPRESPIM